MRRRPLGQFLLGPDTTRQLGIVHVTQALGDGLFAVSLAGSLFFNASIDAARPNILLYLLLTMAPFAVLAPLIGPVVDRVAHGYPRVATTANLTRTAMCLLLAFHLRTVLFYPEALAVLVAAKTYSVAKAALVPRLEPQRRQLLATNARLSRLGALGGATGGALGVVIVTLTRAEVSVLCAGAAFALSAVAAMRLPRPRPEAVFTTPGEQLDELLDPDVLAASAGVAVLRAASGFLAFFIAFELKRSGSPPWLFGVVAVASTIGAVSGTVVGPRLRARYDERALLRGALALPALACLAGSARVVAAVFVVCVFALAMGSNIGRLSFDSIVQGHAPDVDRGRAFAGFETRFQLAWVAGALGPVALRLPPWLGLLAPALLLGAGGLALTAERSVLARWRESVLPTPDLPRSVLEHARRLQSAGQNAHAVMEAALLLELLDAADPAAAEPAESLRGLRELALDGRAGPGEANAAVRAAAALYATTARPPTSPPTP
jgi:hypothetical protein